MRIPSKHLNIIRESFFNPGRQRTSGRSGSMTVKKYRSGAHSPSTKTSVESTDSEVCLTFLSPHPTPQLNAHIILNFKNPSGFHLGLAEANQDIFAIPDSRSPSPIYINTEDMFNISDSPLRCPSPAPSGLASIRPMRTEVFLLFRTLDHHLQRICSRSPIPHQAIPAPSGLHLDFG